MSKWASTWWVKPARRSMRSSASVGEIGALIEGIATAAVDQAGAVSERQRDAIGPSSTG
jgi:hypothetical protein